MKKISYIVVLGMSFMALLSSCVGDPLEGEQYFKQVYLVGANDKLQKKEVAYKDGDRSELFVSVAVSGSAKTEEDVQVSLELAHQVNIDNYNRKNVVGDATPYEALPTNIYELSTWNCTIKAGEQYVRVPISVESAQIDCDKRYVIPLKVKEASVKLAADTVLLVSLKMINNFSGTYMVSGKYMPYDDQGNLMENAPSTIKTERTFTATAPNTIRLYHQVLGETKNNLATSALTFTVNPDNTVKVETWQDFSITDGGGTYNPTTKTFTVWYDYTENGKKYKMELSAEKQNL